MYFEVESLQDRSISSMNRSVENLLISSHEVINSINASSLSGQSPVGSHGNEVSLDNVLDISSSTVNERPSALPSPNLSPRPSPRFSVRHHDYLKDHVDLISPSQKESIHSSKLDDQSIQEILNRSSDSAEPDKLSTHSSKKQARASARSKKKSSWYNVLYPTYKSRSEDFKRIFKDVPQEERLVVDYSCALQREILVHGRLYVTQNYVCFYANIFMWETLVSLRWKDVSSITKEKTALVIPNAISICTENEKYFLTSFGARDKTYLMLFRIWQNALIGEPMGMAEMWQLVHTCYGDELGLTSDDEDYVPPQAPLLDDKLSTRLSVESFSESEGMKPELFKVVGIDIPTRAKLEIRPKPDIILDPTDLSDTTESDAEKQAVKLPIRCNTVCTSPHEGRHLSNTILPIHIDQLFTLLFTNSKFFLDFHSARKTTDLVRSAWTQNPETGEKVRTVTLTMSLTQSVGPRSSQVTENQIMLPCSRPGQLYSIDVESLNAGIPYADSFSVIIHYCMTSKTENETCLAIFAQIKYKKNVWAIVRTFIEKNCWAGLEEYFSSLIKALSVECEENHGGTVGGTGGLKRKTRRRRRTVNTGISLQTHAPDLLSSNHQPSAAELPHNYNKSVSGLRGDTSNILSWVLLFAILCLTLINAMLYYKLWGLEEAANYTVMDLHILKNTPKTEEDWINLLQQQESLHNVEMRKWQRVLHTAAQLLRQTEESLTELQMSIHPTATEKMFSVLKPGLKTRNSNNQEL
ncbi:protein Aster-B-like [Belonocnema kinseyi]|uniref:protein Aster-B-like n=1 Tax=Belonocnema kinseyi TaxID=2817044 RepID=UPI00143CFFFC|nr:protein Aster-B-like [Belonocnema kinseyi]